MKNLTRSLSLALGLGIFSLSVMADDNQEEKTRDCLPMSRIDHIEVKDDSTLVFHMHGDKKYINNLPYKCPGLKQNTFIHETSLHQYCDLDTITVYDASIGMRMASCPLGEFEPYAEREEDSE